MSEQPEKQGSVLKLLPNNALCVDAGQVAERLHALADRIAAGEHGEIERVVVVLESDGGEIDRRTYGRPTTDMELVGLLEWAKQRVILGDDDA